MSSVSAVLLNIDRSLCAAHITRTGTSSSQYSLYLTLNVIAKTKGPFVFKIKTVLQTVHMKIGVEF